LLQVPWDGGERNLRSFKPSSRGGGSIGGKNMVCQAREVASHRQPPRREATAPKVICFFTGGVIKTADKFLVSSCLQTALFGVRGPFFCSPELFLTPSPRRSLVPSFKPFFLPSSRPQAFPPPPSLLEEGLYFFLFFSFRFVQSTKGRGGGYRMKGRLGRGRDGRT
jgi:hypothetical protein